MSSSSNVTNLNLALKLFRLFLPIVGSSLSSCLVGVLAMMMVAHLGEKSLAAGALASSTYITICVISFGLLFVVSILVANAVGAGKREDISIIVQNGFFMAFLMGIPLVLALENITPILLWFHQDPHLVKLTVPFFHYIGFGIIQILFIIVLNQFFLGIGKPRVNLVFNIFQSFMVLFLSYIFIFGKCGFPKFGLGGYSCALSITSTIELIMLVIFIKLCPTYAKYKLFKSWHFNAVYFKKIIFIGVPIGVQFGGELAAFTVSVYMIGWFGSQALAAQQIVTQAVMLSVMVMLGLTQACSVMVSEANGEKNHQLVLRITHIAIGFGVIVMIMVGFVYCFKPDWIVKWFIDTHNPSNQGILADARIFLIIAAFMQVVDCIRDVLNGTLRGLHDSKISMIVGLTCNWIVSLPLCYLFGLIFHGGPAGLRSGFIVGFIICVIILYYYLVKKLTALNKPNEKVGLNKVASGLTIEFIKNGKSRTIQSGN